MSNARDKRKCPAGLDAFSEELETAVEAVSAAAEQGKAVGVSQLPDNIRAGLDRLAEYLERPVEIIWPPPENDTSLRCISVDVPDLGVALTLYKREGENTVCGAAVRPCQSTVKAPARGGLGPGGKASRCGQVAKGHRRSDTLQRGDGLPHHAGIEREKQ